MTSMFQRRHDGRALISRNAFNKVYFIKRTYLEMYFLEHILILQANGDK